MQCKSPGKSQDLGASDTRCSLSSTINARTSSTPLRHFPSGFRVSILDAFRFHAADKYQTYHDGTAALSNDLLSLRPISHPLDSAFLPHSP